VPHGGDEKLVVVIVVVMAEGTDVQIRLKPRRIEL
jgi:hypothetical protein